MEKYIGKELRALTHMLMRCFERSSTRAYVHSITGTNAWIIAYLSDNEGRDVFQRDLESEFGITRSTASKVVDLMVQKGLVERGTVSHDARLRKLTLTDRARELAQLMRADREAAEAALTRGFSDLELEMLFSFIERMKENIGA